MILAAGLTPAWQQILVFDRVQMGEVNRAREVHRCASGKVLNVALALGSLGVESSLLSFAGGAAGQAIRQEFAKSKVSDHWIETATPTRECITIVDSSGARTTELVENAGTATSLELIQFRAVYLDLVSRADFVVLSGSLPMGASTAFYAQLMADTKVPVVLDARGPELLAALEYRPLLVKPNREELGRTLGREFNNDVELLAGMRELNERGASWVLISQGGGTLWVTSHDETFRCQPPSIAPVNAIGSGDCLAAGIAWALSVGQDMPTAIRIGVACATENALTLLPARLDREDVTARAAGLVVELV